MPCSTLGQSYPLPGPPQDFKRFPSWSNSRTGGAGKQHIAWRGELGSALISSGVSLPGRCKTQIWFWLSTFIPPIWPTIQLLGNSLGQEGSTLYCGGATCAELA